MIDIQAEELIDAARRLVSAVQRNDNAAKVRLFAAETILAVYNLLSAVGIRTVRGKNE